MQYRKLISILLLMGVMSLSAQELAVKSFTLQENDLTARTLPRKDINGTECALVKVQIVGQGVTFSGSVMGEGPFLIDDQPVGFQLKHGGDSSFIRAL